MSQQHVMTNLGPRRKGSARLEPLPYGNGRSSQADGAGDPSVTLPDGRAPNAQLPPIARSRDTPADAFDSILVDDVSPGVSPARRARKSTLMARSAADSDHRTVLQTSLALDQKERELALIRDNKREYGRILLELWVNQVLDGGRTGGTSLASTHGLGGGSVGDPLKVDPSALKGLASYGLTRVELLGAGLSHDAVDRLYRCMYVYTVGFFDVMQEILSHNEFRTEILSNVWKGFLTISESALQVAFRSDYLKLYQSQQVAMAELLFAKEQLAEARQDTVNTEQAVAWLTNAHAEERAARLVLKNQLSEMQVALDRERQAHQAAVTKYVAEVEERVRLQAQLVAANAKLAEAAASQVDLVVQRDYLTAELEAAEQRSLRIVDSVRAVYEALAMEKTLQPNHEHVASLEVLLRAAATAAAAAPATSAGNEGEGGRSSTTASAPTSPERRTADASSNPAMYGSEPLTAAAAPSLSWESSPPAADGSVSVLPLTCTLRPSSPGDSSVPHSTTEAGVAVTYGMYGTSDGGSSGQPLSSNAQPLLPSLDPPARAEATLLYSELIADLTKQLYGKWREQTDHTSTAVRSLYELRDNFRSSKVKEHELQVELDRVRALAQSLQYSLNETSADLRSTQSTLGATEKALAALTEAKAAADRRGDDLDYSLHDTRAELMNTQTERNKLLATCSVLRADLASRDLRISTLERRLAVARDSLAECSRAMVVYAKAAAAQDAARGYFKRMYLEASKRAGDLQWALFRAERQIRTLEGKIEHKNTELATLVANSDQAKVAADAVQASLAGAMMEIENKKAMIFSLERTLTAAKETVAKLKQELEEMQLRAEEAEGELEAAKEEIQRQTDGMQSLEARLAAAGEERTRLLKQVERLVAEKNEIDRSGKQVRDTLQSEINRRGTEISSQRSEIDKLNARIEALQGAVADTKDQLERKREKKRRWKVAQSQIAVQADMLRGTLAKREGVLAELSARLKPLENDVAVLIADRGRDPPHFKPVPQLSRSLSRSVIRRGSSRREVVEEEEDQTDIDLQTEQAAWDECNRASLELAGRLESQHRTMEAARREYEVARLSFYEAPLEESRKTALLGIEAVLAKLRVERAETEADLGRLREKQVAHQARMQAFENAAFNRRMAALEKRTDSTESALKNELITRLDEARERITQLQATLEQQSGVATTAQNRAAKLEMDFIKTETEMRELTDKLKKTVEFKVELERQVAQYKNMVGFLQAEVSALSRERDALKANLQEVDSRVERLTADVTEAQSAIGTTSKRLEAKFEAEKREALAAAIERQKTLEGKLSAAETRIKDLEAMCSTASESFRRFLASSLTARETANPPIFIWHINRPPALHDAVLACAAAPDITAPSRSPSPGPSNGPANGIPTTSSVVVTTSGPTGPLTPPWTAGTGDGTLDASSRRSSSLPPPPSLSACLGKVPYSTNFDYERDTVLGFLSATWSFEVTLVTISQVYVEKLQADMRAEDGLLGGVAGPRHSLELVMYELFTSRFGCRQVAELHLGAFLAAVRKYRGQHPKVRTFARLLGLPEPPPTTPGLAEDMLASAPLPPSAMEFYLSLVNRVHARAGPLIAEAAEGFSLVKSKVLSRLAREFLRGSYNTTMDEVASTPDHIRHMALNDDEKAIDLELALEAILRAFVMQYNDDLNALFATFRTSFEAASRRLVTPDDLAMFLRTLNSEKAASLPVSRALSLYVEASRAAGPSGEHLGKELCRVILNSGFVGISTHVTRHEPMRALPPYDEFEMLEESWRLMRVAVEQQVAVIKSHSEIKCDVLSYVDLARRVDELVGGRDSPIPAWSTYRRLLTLYCSQREAVDAILPFDPPIGGSLRNNRNRANCNVSVQDGDRNAGGQGDDGGYGSDLYGTEGGGNGATDSEMDPISGSTSRDVSPLSRRATLRPTISHKSMGVALSRMTSQEGLEEAAAVQSNTAVNIGEVRRRGKLLAPKGP